MVSAYQNDHMDHPSPAYQIEFQEPILNVCNQLSLDWNLVSQFHKVRVTWILQFLLPFYYLEESNNTYKTRPFFPSMMWNYFPHRVSLLFVNEKHIKYW